MSYGFAGLPTITSMLWPSSDGYTKRWAVWSMCTPSKNERKGGKEPGRSKERPRRYRGGQWKLAPGGSQVRSPTGNGRRHRPERAGPRSGVWVPTGMNENRTACGGPAGADAVQCVTTDSPEGRAASCGARQAVPTSQAGKPGGKRKSVVGSSLTPPPISPHSHLGGRFSPSATG